MLCRQTFQGGSDMEIWVVVSNVFYFQPYLEKIPILTNIFQMGLKPPTRDIQTYLPPQIPYNNRLICTI